MTSESDSLVIAQQHYATESMAMPNGTIVDCNNLMAQGHEGTGVNNKGITMNILLMLMIALTACASEPRTTVHDPRCYTNGQYDPDLGADDLDCANDPITISKGE